MNIFCYVKPQMTLDGINLKFHDVFYSFYTLMRVVTLDGWWMIYIDAFRKQQPNFTCQKISNYEDYSVYGLSGCGNPFATIYFFSFYLIVSRFIVNLFVSMLLNATEKVLKIEESSVNRFKLTKILKLWEKYDPYSEGFINYKLFWRFSSEIAIIFGVEQKDLLQTKNKKNFLQVLNLPVYENVQSKVFCYQFHDVVLKLAKIFIFLKYGDPE